MGCGAGGATGSTGSPFRVVVGSGHGLPGAPPTGIDPAPSSVSAALVHASGNPDSPGLSGLEKKILDAMLRLRGGGGRGGGRAEKVGVESGGETDDADDDPYDPVP